jgi:hypothetical protein
VQGSEKLTGEVAVAPCQQRKETNQGNPGNRGKENGGNLSNGSSQSARKNTASVSAEQTASSTTSSLI